MLVLALAIAVTSDGFLAPHPGLGRTLSNALALVDWTTPGMGSDPYAPGGVKTEQAMAVGLLSSAVALLVRQGTLPDGLTLLERARDSLLDLGAKNTIDGGAYGWGLGYRWDAFGDGTTNPRSTVYGITLAIVTEGLLDDYELTRDQASLGSAVRALNSYLPHQTSASSGTYFWYSDQPSDARPVVNVSAMLAAQYARAGRLADRPDFTAAAGAVLSWLLRSATVDEQGVSWPYAAGQTAPNDLVHAAYSVHGVLTAARELDVSSPNAAMLRYLRGFLGPGGAVETSGGANPARVWGVGYLMYVLCHDGGDQLEPAAASLLDPYEWAPGAFGTTPGSETSYTRDQAHVILGLAACSR